MKEQIEISIRLDRKEMRRLMFSHLLITLRYRYRNKNKDKDKDKNITIIIIL